MNCVTLIEFQDEREPSDVSPMTHRSSTTGRRLIVAIWAFFLASSHGFAATSIESIPVCYNFGCKTKELVAITQQEWAEVSGWFDPPAATAADERQQIRQAIGWMEVVVGNHTPTHRDTGLDLQLGGEFPGQLDCIDESLNTTTYLRLFEYHGLLRHHRVRERAYRRAIFDQHWAGQIEEKDSGARFVVDSWFHDNGILPYVQTMDEWMDIPFLFSATRDNSPEYDEYQEPRWTPWRALKDRLTRGSSEPEQ